VLFNDRPPRPGEAEGVEYYFRPRHDIEDLDGKPGYVVLPVRRDLQALEVAQVLRALDQRRNPIFEGNAYIAEALMSATELLHIPKVSVFLSPMSLEEILYLRAQPDLDLETVVSEVMREKLTRRTTRQKGVLSDQDLHDIEARCLSAYKEMQYAPQFDWVIPNHDGEDSDNWSVLGYPLGDARRSLLDFAAILQGKQPRWAEKWPGEVFGG
jgi:guanylate kinase